MSQPFVVSLLIDADGKAAVSELRQLGAEARKTGKATEDLAKKAKSGGAAVQGAAKSASVAGKAHDGAAGQVGNMTAQFNDLIVGVQAGQSPMQMAIQQGLQITQVFGQTGGAGALKTLKSAALSMVSPLNLVTIGAIAAGAALASWLTDPGEKAASFEERLGDLGDQMDRYAEVVENARLPTDDLIERFGSGAEAARAFFEELIAIEGRQSRREVSGAINSMLDETGLDLPRWDSGDATKLASSFGISGAELNLGKSRYDTRPIVHEVMNAYAQLSEAAEGSVDQQIAALDRLFTALEAAANYDGRVSEGEDARLQDIIELRQRIGELNAQDEAVGRSKVLNLEALKASYRDLIDAAIEEHQTAADMLATLERQNEIAAATARFGANSAQVAQLKADAERQALEEGIDALNVTEDTKDAIRAAADEAYRLASANIAGPISAAAKAAANLASRLAAAVSNLEAMRNQAVSDVQIAEIRAATVGNPVERAAQLAGARYDAEIPTGLPGFIRDQMDFDAGRADVVANARRVAELNEETTAAERRLRSSSSRGGGAKAEADAVSDLIESLEDQLALLRETDPVQKEMLRNREALIEATSAERDAIEELITQRIAEEEAVERLEEARQEFRQTLYDSIRDLIFEGESYLDVLENIAVKIADVALQAALLGEGPLGNLFGGADAGGGLGMIFDGIAGLVRKGFASGGPTGGTDPTRVAGVVHEREFVFDAASTERIGVGNLEALRRGRLPGFASGGYVGRPPLTGNGGAATVMLQPIIENHSSAQVEASVEETVGPAGQRTMRLVLADQVGQALVARGGGARRNLRQEYGVRKPGTQR
jgi:hypothetical protein